MIHRKLYHRKRAADPAPKTLTTTAPADMNARYWELSCRYDMHLCEELMGETYNKFILLTDDSFTSNLSWKELKARLLRVRGLYLELSKQATPEQLLERFMEALPDGYLD
ncbi:MAG TPA: hypothetical protein VIH16_03640 [Bellilinea sp.]